MNNYKTTKLSKDSLIYEEGNYPKDTFYIITKGKAVSYANNSKNYDKEYNTGSIVGLVNLATNEPYFVSIKAVEEVEIIEINLSDIKNLTNYDLIKKIYEYLNNALEMWLSKFYTVIIKNKVDLYYKESIFTMADIYKKHEFYDTAYKIYDEYIKDSHYAENLEESQLEEAQKELSKLPAPYYPSQFSDNVYLYKKGSCLYTELKADDCLYIIMSGKIGIYNIINGELILKDAYKRNYILDAYRPKLEYKPLLTSAIALESSYVKKISKEEFIVMMIKDKQLRLYNIKMMSIKVVNTLLKLRAIEENNTTLKLFIIITAILKIEILFEDTESITLSHTISDIKNTINIDEETILNNFKKISSIEIIENKNIKIININDFFKEYYKYQQNNY